MKKIILLLIIIVIGVVGYFYYEKNDIKDITVTKVKKVDKIDSMINNMSLDEKIGQMIIIAYRNDEVDNTLENSIKEVKPGGFILFSENFTTYDKTIKFIKDIKSLSKIPMFISVDQEGGNVQRLLYLQDKEVSNIPYMYDVGSKNDLEYTYNVGRVIAEELRVFGINMDFAPCIDVYSNVNNTVIGKRSFGKNAEIVSKQGIKLANGLRDNGIIPVYKHFPGHGNTSVDSHFDLPIVNKSKEELMKLDLIPFINAIKEDASVIMIGHLAVPKITGNNEPASLSKKLITYFLKDELEFKGLVTTDSLEMGAITNRYKEEDICGMAVESGVDILLMPTSSRTCLNSVKTYIKNGKINETDINNSVKKILKLKENKIKKDYDEYLSIDYLNSKEHQKILNK